MSTMSVRNFLLLLLLLGLLAAFLELGRMDVSTANEGQRAAPPAEMIRSGDFVLPTLNGKPYLAKPPLLYWIIAGLYRATGVTSEWTARVPTATSFVLLALCIYLLFRRPAGETVARWAALCALSAPYFLERARWANLDVPLTLTTFLAVMALHAAWNAGGAGRRYTMASLGGVALAAATMLKGPVPYLFVATAALAYLLAESGNPGKAARQVLLWSLAALGVALILWVAGLASLGRLHLRFPLALVLLCGGWLWCVVRAPGAPHRHVWPPLLCAVALAIVLCAPWAVAVLQRLGWDYLHGLLNAEVTDRTHTATAINSGSPFYFVLALPVMLAPFGLLLPLHASRRAWHGFTPFYRYCVLAGWMSVALFSAIAGKEYEYVLPGVPFLLGALAFHLAHGKTTNLEGWEARYRNGWQRVMAVLLPVLAVGLPIYTVIEEFHVPLVIEETVIGLLALVILFRGDRRALTARWAVAAVLLVAGVMLTRSFHYTGKRSPKAIARQCGDLVEAGYTVESSKVYPEFTFYAEHPIEEVIDPDTVRERMEGEAPYFYLTREKFLTGSEEAAGVSVISGPQGLKKLVLLANPAGAAVVPNAT